MITNTSENTESQSGNVLFLILIAVALFAALSYAVTSSTRGPTSGASNEQTLIGSAQITQFPAAVSNSIIRMVISGTSVDEIRFNRPSEFSTLDTPTIGVFHPQGGTAVYSQAPKNIMVSGTPGDWVFNGELEVPDIGTTDASGSNDIIAYLIGIKQSVCKKIDEEYGIGSTIPVLSSDLSASYSKRMYDNGSSDYSLPTTDVSNIDDGSGSFDGQPFGCFQNAGGGDYVYYHVVAER